MQSKTISGFVYFPNFTKILNLVVGSKNKLKRFRENETFHNVIQPEREDAVSGNFPLKGNWRDTFFKNQNPIGLK